ncbi:hypothetical protein EYZ11_001242 [Aspergillus tanneri]|uniref:Uncharacterized protein n=1 Tax=Aspergillus tanneri TaxID=1220188 RepID=A0A4S3JV38_9EURO|nr:hypothetical protein EYZ11_001242 [Aspergillus tanneri]
MSSKGPFTGFAVPQVKRLGGINYYLSWCFYNVFYLLKETGTLFS